MASKMIGKLRKVNIQTNEGKALYRSKRNEYDDAIPSLFDFVKSDEVTPVVCRYGDVYKVDNSLAFVNDNVVLVDSSYSGSTDLCFLGIDDGDKGYLVPHGKKTVVLVNGDSTGFDSNPIVDSGDFDKMPTISFGCLNQFYGNKSGVVLKKVKNKKILILDFVPDSRIEFTAAQKRRLKAVGEGNSTDRCRILEELGKNPPEPGYTILSHGWHRSATVLLYDTETKSTILMGQDEGTYFGVELADAAKTINEAYDSLTPNEVKGKKFVRQGEWFIINVKDSEVPSVDECIAEFDTSSGDENFWLPRDGEDSNKHYLEAEGRISREGVLYAKHPQLSHEEHEAVGMSGWCRFYKNTAIRSFSQEGVD